MIRWTMMTILMRYLALTVRTQICYKAGRNCPAFLPKIVGYTLGYGDPYSPKRMDKSVGFIRQHRHEPEEVIGWGKHIVENTPANLEYKKALQGFAKLKPMIINRLKIYGLFLLFFLGIGHVDAQTAHIDLCDTGHTVINKNIYGQFAEHLGRGIYDGFYRNGKIRQDVALALKKIRVPNLRWPGGCFADQYHWRDGIGEQAKRPQTVNTTWGMVTENNSFGTAEFMELCRLIGCEPYIAGNVGTGSPQEMKDWVEYLNFDGKSSMADRRRADGHPAPYGVGLWGVGNESWGCGGNMTPEYYAELYRHYAAFCPDYPGARLKKIAGGANAGDDHWTEVLMKNIPAEEMYGLSLHYYTFPSGKWQPRGAATRFSEAEYAHTLKEALRIEEMVDRHEAIMDKYDPQRKVALLVDEWGVWTDPEPGTNPHFMYQQNSLRDALIAAATLNIFNNHAERVRGANLAQAVNVIQSLILTRGDQMLLTPTYHVFELYQVHQEARLLPLRIRSPQYGSGRDSVPALSASASVDQQGETHISLVNLDPLHSIPLTITMVGSTYQMIKGALLSSSDFTDINTFEQPEKVRIRPFFQAQLYKNQIKTTLPPLSLVMLTLKK